MSVMFLMPGLWYLIITPNMFSVSNIGYYLVVCVMLLLNFEVKVPLKMIFFPGASALATIKFKQAPFTMARPKLECTAFAVAFITHCVDVAVHILDVPSGLFDWLEAKFKSQEKTHRIEI